MPTSIDPEPRENEIECARCGAIFFYELTRCPNCGVSLYEPDDDEESRLSSRLSQNQQGILEKISRFFRRLWGEPHPADKLFQAALNQASLYDDLLRKVGGDRTTAHRLIEFERQRFPDRNHLQWLQSAIQRWEQDNRAH
jgi:hypothetical protein